MVAGKKFGKTKERHDQALFNEADNTFTDSFGTLLVNIHPQSDDCLKYGCVVHNPSDHVMKDWPLYWRGDRYLFERICKHGTGHPCPDHISFLRRVAGDKYAETESIHGCCGCESDKNNGLEYA